ncbi:hypothetical protein ABLA30_14235 [Xenorhabdus nematophila]|uniref:hypothetical protein n=1 Tax=Xenorhabdus nematophila TaxID=628 RepID=UPI0032B801BB
MQKKEPVIITNGNTIEEVYQWMENKLKARRAVATLANELNSLNRAREGINQQFVDAVNQSELNLYKQDYDREINNDPIMEIERKRIELICSIHDSRDEEHAHE